MNLGGLLSMFSGGMGGNIQGMDSDFVLILALVLLLSTDCDDRALIFALIFILT